MISNSLLKLVSGALLVAMTGILAWEISRQNPTDYRSPDEEGGRTIEGLFISTDPDAVSENGEPSQFQGDAATEIMESTNAAIQTGGRLTTGLMGATPTQDEILNLSEIPWLLSQVSRAFREAEQNSCTLLVPDLPLDPTLSVSRPGSRRSLGRIPAFTVGLEIDESAKKNLPVASRGAIHAYLRDHRLAVEPTIYESEAGKLYFGTDCRAACYKYLSPSRTVKAEPLIEDAMGRFRCLGVLGGDLASGGRTLLMAFRYAKSNNRITSAAGGLETATELLFLHMDADATPQNLTFSAFVTSEERQQLHELAINRMVLRDPIPTITASIRFDSFVMMGMYPANPVVTGVRHQASGTLPVQTVRSLIEEKTATDHRTLEDVFDQFGELSHRSDLLQ